MATRRFLPKKTSQARDLRKNSTPAERCLWKYLKNDQLTGIHFRRQHPIGPYIVDFCAIKKKLVIELDGSGHLEQKEYDRERTSFLNEHGYRVLRFWNDQVMNDLDGVICVIQDALEEK